MHFVNTAENSIMYHGPCVSNDCTNYKTLDPFTDMLHSAAYYLIFLSKHSHHIERACLLACVCACVRECVRVWVRAWSWFLVV